MSSPARTVSRSCSRTRRPSAGSPCRTSRRHGSSTATSSASRPRVEYGLLTLHLDGGARPTLVYPKPDHAPASYTILNFPVDDIDAAVDALTERGVEMLRYDGMPQDERGIMREEGPVHRVVRRPGGQRAVGAARALRALRDTRLLWRRRSVAKGAGSRFGDTVAMTDALARAVRVARGQEPADLVVRGARVVDVLTQQIRPADVAIVGDRIVAVGRHERPAARETIEAAGRYVAPGLIDAHVHIESSMVAPGRFADAVLPHGTTTVVSDPHEIANVLGVEGVRWMLAASEGLDLSVLMMAPACVPASPLETAGARLEAERPDGLGRASARAGPGRDDELPGRARRRPGRAGQVDGLLGAADRRPRAGRARRATCRPTSPRASSPTTSA